MAVLINWWLYGWSFGLLLCSFLFYLFLTRLELFLLIISFLDSFSSFFQSLTVANRLSINLMAGSLLTSLLSVACGVFWGYVLFFSLLSAFLLMVFSFELLNSSIQLFIFGLLSCDYLVILLGLTGIVRLFLFLIAAELNYYAAVMIRALFGWSILLATLPPLFLLYSNRGFFLPIIHSLVYSFPFLSFLFDRFIGN